MSDTSREYVTKIAEYCGEPEIAHLLLALRDELSVAETEMAKAVVRAEKAEGKLRLVLDEELKAKALVELEAELARVMGALELVLPMARGYAAANRVGSNAAYISLAEAALAGKEGGK